MKMGQREPNKMSLIQVWPPLMIGSEKGQGVDSVSLPSQNPTNCSMGKEHSEIFKSRMAQISKHIGSIPMTFHNGMPLTSWVTLDKLLNLSGPLFFLICKWSYLSVSLE